MLSRTVTIDVAGSPMSAYLAVPTDVDIAGRRPAVIVLQEIFGVNAEVKRITELLAGAGYVGLAINYYHRTDPDLNEPYTPAGMQNGFKAAGAVTKATLRADVAAAIDWLNASDAVTFNKIVSWGFCFGGTTAFITSTLPGLNGVVCFYGGSIAKELPDGESAPINDAAEIRCPLLLVYGGQDDYITSADIEATRTALTAAKKPFDIQVYPDVGHAFFRDSGALLENDPDPDDATSLAVADAWDLVQSFLGKHCG